MNDVSIISEPLEDQIGRLEQVLQQSRDMDTSMDCDTVSVASFESELDYSDESDTSETASQPVCVSQSFFEGTLSLNLCDDNGERFFGLENGRIEAIHCGDLIGAIVEVTCDVGDNHVIHLTIDNTRVIQYGEELDLADKLEQLKALAKDLPEGVVGDDLFCVFLAHWIGDSEERAESESTDSEQSEQSFSSQVASRSGTPSGSVKPGQHFPWLKPFPLLKAPISPASLPQLFKRKQSPLNPFKSGKESEMSDVGEEEVFIKQGETEATKDSSEDNTKKQSKDETKINNTFSELKIEDSPVSETRTPKREKLKEEEDVIITSVVRKRPLERLSSGGENLLPKRVKLNRKAEETKPAKSVFVPTKPAKSVFSVPNQPANFSKRKPVRSFYSGGDFIQVPSTPLADRQAQYVAAADLRSRFAPRSRDEIASNAAYVNRYTRTKPYIRQTGLVHPREKAAILDRLKERQQIAKGEMRAASEALRTAEREIITPNTILNRQRKERYRANRLAKELKQEGREVMKIEGVKQECVVKMEGFL